MTMMQASMPPTASAARTVTQAINAALQTIFAEDDRVYLLGEDVLDPYGGAFKVSRGLSTRWPERVLTSPISEAALAGLAGGMALRGLRPVVEIMFGDFLTLTFDQLLNHAAKFTPMYNGQVSCPLTVRTPMGGGRGYGPTHSQSLEKFFTGVPGLDVAAVSPYHDIERFYRQAILQSSRPTLIIENKQDYARPYRPVQPAKNQPTRSGDFTCQVAPGPYPALHFSLGDFEESYLTVLTYGPMAQPLLELARELLIEHELYVEVVVIGCLNQPLPPEVLEACRRSGRVLTLEEGTEGFHIGAEWARQLSENIWPDLHYPVRTVTARADIIPCARQLEAKVLPGKTDILAALGQLLNRRLTLDRVPTGPEVTP